MLTSFDSLDFKYKYWNGKGTKKIIIGKNPVLAKVINKTIKVFSTVLIFLEELMLILKNE